MNWSRRTRANYPLTTQNGCASAALEVATSSRRRGEILGVNKPCNSTVTFPRVFQDQASATQKDERTTAPICGKRATATHSSSIPWPRLIPSFARPIDLLCPAESRRFDFLQESWTAGHGAMSLRMGQFSFGFSSETQPQPFQAIIMPKIASIQR
jgi:hypothetical protein